LYVKTRMTWGFYIMWCRKINIRHYSKLIRDVKYVFSLKTNERTNCSDVSFPTYLRGRFQCSFALSSIVENLKRTDNWAFEPGSAGQFRKVIFTWFIKKIWFLYYNSAWYFLINIRSNFGKRNYFLIWRLSNPILNKLDSYPNKPVQP
jgi:hypothetical protein